MGRPWGKNLGVGFVAHWLNWIGRWPSKPKVPSSSLGWVTCGGLAQLEDAHA